MKMTNQELEIQKFLATGKIVSGGFLGRDNRSYLEIIEADRLELARLGVDCSQLAVKMKAITNKAVEGFGNWVKINSKLDAKVDEAKGAMICPWPHKTEIFYKRVTTLRDIESGEEFRWSDLCIHFISDHCFFQGKGAAFRIEPAKIAKILFIDKSSS